MYSDACKKIKTKNTVVVPVQPRVTFSASKIHGRGVFALRRFRAGEEIEVCHVVLMPWDQVSAGSVLSHYVFDWDEDSAAMVLGCGSLYNHSEDPCAHVVMDYDEQTAHFIATRTIRGGEEITIDYGDEYDRTW